MNAKKPSVLLILADEWRAQSVGYAGDPNARTPNIDALAAESVNFGNAVSGAPVCCPARASLVTGQYPLTHGVYINDVALRPNGTTLGEAFRDAGYRTGYIGKWHLYGSPDGRYGRRDEPVPAEAHLGFGYWKAAECTHEYNSSFYFEGADPEMKCWSGYDAEAQTTDACRFIAESADEPYLLVLAWGPPHFPLDTAPERFRKSWHDREIRLPPNVPEHLAGAAREALRGYYAHIEALDECVGRLLEEVGRSGRADDTIVVFTSDHGDMMGSQGFEPNVKHVPWDESVRVPLLIRYPTALGGGRTRTAPVGTPDLMPTLLSLCGLPVPDSVQGSDALSDPAPGEPEGAFLGMAAPILLARTYGIGEYRGVRTARHTYVRSQAGPWLLYDNQNDPYQQRNLCEDPGHEELRRHLDTELDRWLEKLGDQFLPGDDYLNRDGLIHYLEVCNPVGDSQAPNGSWRSTIPAHDPTRRRAVTYE